MVNLDVFSVQSQTMWRPQWRQLWSFMRQMKTGTSWHFSPGRSLAFSLILPLFHDPHESIHLLTFPLGWSGESGVASAGAGQDSVETWHEETPQNFAHVLWSALPWPNEGLWEGPPLCSQGNLQSVKCLPSFTVEILSSWQVYTVPMWLECKLYLKASCFF